MQQIPVSRILKTPCGPALNFPVRVLVQQPISAVDMAFPKHSILQALSVLLLAWVLVRCQAPLEAEEEEEGEANTAATGAKSEPSDCPLKCSCTADGAVDCAGVDLTEFPAELSENTRQLSLQVFGTTVLHILLFCLYVTELCCCIHYLCLVS